LLESAQIFGAAYEKLESARTAFELGLLAQNFNDSVNAQKYFNEATEIFTEVGAEKELQCVETAMIQIAV
jgi:hypothetical protein